MGNLIMNAFAFKEDYATSMQLGKNIDAGVLELYMQNIFVSLVSAKLHNPEDDVMLVVNMPIPAKYQELYERHGILIQVIAFDTFVMPKQFVWALAFFKLCALDYITRHTEYEHIVLLDADTVTMRPYTDMWKEADEGILLFAVGHSYSHPDRWAITEAYRKLYEVHTGSITHIGGEYICGERKALRGFMRVCTQVYERIRESRFAVFDHAGDEFILSVAADRADNIISAAPYIYRYWTEGFYLVSTNTVSNPVCIWHLPSEKDTGMLRLYRYYQKHGVFPKAEKCAKMVGIVPARRPKNGYWLMNKISRKLKRV